VPRLAILALLLALATGGRVGAAAQAPAGEASGAAPATVAPPATPAALRYYREGNLIFGLARLAEVALPLLFVASGAAVRLERAARRASRRWFRWLRSAEWLGSFALFAAAALALWTLALLPLAWWAGFARPHRYGLSTETLGAWLGDWGKSFLVELAVVLGVGWVPWRLIARRPRWWWAWTAVLALPFLFVTLYLAPLVVDPLFHDFAPMAPGPLRERVMTLAAAAGIPETRVLVADLSTETRTVNAYVTGFLDSHRVVLWDTLLARLAPDEVAAVVGHELGHYVLGHVWRTLLAIGALGFLALWLVARLGAALVAWRGERWGVAGPAALAALPLHLAALAVVSLLLSPVGLAVSRHHERQADRFALALTGDAAALSGAFVALQRHNLSNPRPGPVFRLLRASHPSLAERVEWAAAEHARRRHPPA
jgi:Zn-dependent protease with chaperone function